MKFGIRKPSLKKSFSARTKGQLTRSIKRALIPGYGKRGMGWLHPKRALYNRVYHRTTVGVGDIARLAAGAAAAKQRPARTAARTAAPAAAHRPTRAERVQRLRLRYDVLSAAEQQEVDAYITPKLPSKRTAYLLWFFTGLLGGHRFYLKSYISGALMAIFLIALTPLTVLWWIIDLFRLSGMLDDRKLELGEEAVTNIEQRHLEEQKLHPAPIVETVDPKPAAAAAAHVDAPAEVPVEAWYPADTEKFQRNEAETEFLRQLYVLLKDKGLSPNPMAVHRLSDGTLKFTYGGQELGRVRLQKRKHTVTVWQNDQETKLEGELPDFLPKLESWLERVRKE